MASVVFSADISDAKEIVRLHLEVSRQMAEERPEANRLKESGFRLGNLLESPAGSARKEYSFSLQCWEGGSADLRKLAKDILAQPGFKNIKVVGLN